MDLFGNWFKTRDKQIQEEKEFYSSTFPFGKVQQDKVNNLINELKNSEDITMAIYYYLIVKSELKNISQTEYNMKDFYKQIKSIVRGKSKDNIFKYIVLAKYDLAISEELNYPDINKIIEEAVSLESEINR